MQLDFPSTTFRVCNRHSTILYQRLNYDHHTSHLKLTSGSMKRSRKFGFFPSALRRLFRNKVLRLNMKRSLRLPKMGGLTLLQLLLRGGFEGSSYILFSMKMIYLGPQKYSIQYVLPWSHAVADCLAAFLNSVLKYFN